MDLLLSIDPYRLVCPKERYEKDEGGKVTTVDGSMYHLLSNPYYISYDEKKNSDHTHSLLCRNKEEGDVYNQNLSCLSCSQYILEKTYYFCNNCDGNYHNLCIESLSIFQFSDHPKHPLHLVWFPDYNPCCVFCKKSSGSLFYFCFICNFIIHPICATNPTPFTIDNPKRHVHTLHYFPRKSTLVCDVCALEGCIDYLYVCLQCDFIIHKQCVDLPYVIRVSRHKHRLAFTPSIPYKVWTNCGICHAKIDGNYGKYSCINGCAYAVHTRCALRSDVSDGKELEGKRGISYHIKMFQEEGDGIIRYSSHRHHQMKLEKQIQRAYDERKYCRMCILPFIDDGTNVYRCMECDFILHESCVYNHAVKLFILHPHPLFLEPQVSILPGSAKSWFQCEKCYRYSCGFAYVCRTKMCDYKLDTLCASISEPFDYHSHPHSLFVTYSEGSLLVCYICRTLQRQPLNCVVCKFDLCFGCATLPNKVKYEHDQHLLTFTYEKTVFDAKVYGCEICEEDINPKKGLYACNECGVAVHI